MNIHTEKALENKIVIEMPVIPEKNSYTEPDTPSTEPPTQPPLFSYEYVDGGIRLTGFNYEYTDTVLIIPEQFDNETVVEIGDWAFADNSYIEELIISDYVCRIGESAFRNNVNLNTVTIGMNITEIGAYAFSQLESRSEPRKFTLYTYNYGSIIMGEDALGATDEYEVACPNDEFF